MDKNKVFVGFGEIMLRLKSPGHERFFQSPGLEASFGGGESNVCVSLSLLGRQSRFVTVLPDSDIGEAAAGELRRYGVDTSQILRGKDRMGIYFLETGANQRASKVIYDREASGISKVKPGDFNWDKVFEGAAWLHITGITPALSGNAAQVSIEAVREAKRLGLQVSIDLNYRKKLWNYGKAAHEVMGDLVRYADLIIANEEDIQLSLGIGKRSRDIDQGHLDNSAYQDLAAELVKSYPSVSRVAVTLRKSISADRNGWSAVLFGKQGFHQSRSYEIDDIIDRVGGGDSFSAGLIYGLTEYESEAEALNFAVAASALKHSIPGDFNLSRLEEVLALAGGDGSGRVQR